MFAPLVPGRNGFQDVGEAGSLEMFRQRGWSFRQGG